MGDDCGDFFFCYAVFLCVLQMVCEGRISDSACHERNHCYDALCFYIDCLCVPYFAEEYIVVQVSEHRSKVSKLIPTCCLCNFFCHICLQTVLFDFYQTVIAFTAAKLFCIFENFYLMCFFPLGT